MSKSLRWMLDELDRWTAEGILSHQQAEQIRRLYPDPKAGLPWGTIVFSSLGAVVVGLGIILLFAYNWDALPKGVKLSVVFAALAGAHGSGLALLAQPDWRRQLGQAVGVLGTMLFGAGIWLIAQIYHIDEHFPTGFLIWGLGALAMAWAVPSVAQGHLAAIILTIWAWYEAMEFHRLFHGGPLLMLAAIGGLAWRQGSPVLLGLVLLGVYVTSLCHAGVVDDNLIIHTALNLSALFLGVGILARRHGLFPGSAPVWRGFGWVGFLLCLFLMTFEDLAGDLFPSKSELAVADYIYRIYWWATPLLACVAWARVAMPFLKSSRSAATMEDCPVENWLVPLAAVGTLALPAIEQETSPGWLLGVTNLAYLAMTAAWMHRGIRNSSLADTLVGSVLFSALALARYFDLFDNLAARGLVFLIVGGVLFAEGILFSRARRRARQSEVS